MRIDSFTGKNFHSTEAAFQAAKSDNKDVRFEFMKMSPASAKKAGRTVALRSDWEDVKDEVMYDVCMSKFRDNDELHLTEKLLATGDAELVEVNTWHDNYWGDCSCEKCKDIKGRNQLGKTLMRIRDELKSSDSASA